MHAVVKYKLFVLYLRVSFSFYLRAISSEYRRHVSINLNNTVIIVYENKFKRIIIIEGDRRDTGDVSLIKIENRKKFKPTITRFFFI